MAFPFPAQARLRQRILLAIGGTGLVSASALAPACTTKHPADPPDAAAAGTRATASGGTGGKLGRAGSGGAIADRSGGRSGAAGTTATSAMCFGGTIAMRECFSRAELEQKVRFGCGMIQVTPMPTEAQVQATFLPNGCLPRTASCDGCCNQPEGEGEPGPNGTCCYMFCAGVCCGRPFVVEGVQRTAAAVMRDDWTSGSAPDAGDQDALSRRIAGEWLADAQLEHASIASFARFTLELLAFGAPAELLELSQRAALDEVEHARLCFGLASRYSGAHYGPAPLALGGVAVAADLGAAALAAFHEGCVGETLAALQVAEARDRAGDPAVRDALGRIAEDEARHAELAWRFVAWANQQLGGELSAELVRAFEQVASSFTGQPEHEHEPIEVCERLHAAGRLTASDKARLSRAGLHDVIAPGVDALVAAAARARA